MPPEWIGELYEAADSVDNQRIFRLIEQIPVAPARVANTLAALVHNFRGDKILDLIKQSANSKLRNS